MKGVLVKALADLRRRRLQAVVVALVVMLSSLAGTLAVSLLVESDAPFDHAFEHASGAHLVVRFDTSKATPAQLAASMRAPLVAAAGGPWAETSGLEVDSGFGRMPLQLLGRANPGGPVDVLTLVAGRWVQRNGEVVLAQRNQKGLGLAVGDRVPLTPGQGIDSLKVVGIAAAVNDPSDGWLMPDQVAATRTAQTPGAKGAAPPTAVVFYRLHSATTPAQINAAAKQVTGGMPTTAVVDVSNWLDAKRGADTTTAVMIPFLLAFSVFALVAAAMIIGNVVSGAVIAGYREIGIMKSVGFTPAQVVSTLAIQMLVPAAAGAVVGIAGGVAASRPFLDQTAAAFDLPPEAGLVPFVLAGCLATVLAVVAMATLLPALRAGRMSAAEAISSGTSPQGRGGRRTGRLLARLGWPRATTLGISDAIARPVRSGMTLVAVAIGVATITFATGMTRSLDMVKHSLTHDQAIQATLYRGGGPGFLGTEGGLSDQQVVALIQGRPGTLRFTAEGFLQVSAEGVGQPVRLFGYRGDASWMGYDLLAGRWFSGPGEVVAPQALLDASGKNVGDTLTLSLDGRQESERIVGVIFDSDGDNILLRGDWSGVAGLAPNVTPIDYPIQVKPGVQPRRYASDLVTAAADPQLDVRFAGQGDNDATFLLIEGVLGGLATILTLIALAGVFNTVVLNTREKARDTAILRALGMTPGQVVSMVLTSVLVIAIAGAIVGIPAGEALHRQVLTAMGQIASSTPVPGRFYAVFPALLLAGLAAAGIAVGTLGAWLPATWAARERVSGLLATE